MRQPWNAFLELLWPSRHDPIAGHERRIALLQTLLAIAIALAAGPEVFAAMEMTAVMELLGALLFLTAMSVGAQLVAQTFWNSVRGMLFPLPLPITVRAPGSPLTKTLAALYVAGHAAWCLAMTLNCRVVGATPD
jgi:hypothetical protein